MNLPAGQIFPEASEPISADMERRARRRLLWLHVAIWAAPYVGLGALCLLFGMAHEVITRFLLGLNDWTLLLVSILGLIIVIGAVVYCGFLHAVLRCKRAGREPERCTRQVVYDTIGYLLLQATVICVVIPFVIIFISEARHQ